MIPLNSALENKENEFSIFKTSLEQQGFTLGGSWDYDHGSFDRSLDEAQKVWLRIPFKVTRGHIDDTMEGTDAFIQLGTPFVLRHLYNEGLENEAKPNTWGGMVNQFQTPVDTDAEVGQEWVDKADSILKEIEQKILH